MANRMLAQISDGKPNEDGIFEGWHSVLRVDRSAAGQPGLLFVIEDYDGGLKAGETCVTVPDGNAFLAPVLDWLNDAPRISETDLNRMAQRFYEVASASGVIEFPSVSAKPAIVDALRAALEYVGRA